MTRDDGPKVRCSFDSLKKVSQKMEPKVTLSTKSVHTRLGKNVKEGLLYHVTVVFCFKSFGKPKKKSVKNRLGNRSVKSRLGP